MWLKAKFPAHMGFKLVECEEGVGVNLFSVVVTKQQVVSLQHAGSSGSTSNENCDNNLL